MHPIALVTDQESLPFDFDMPLIEAAFRERGIDVRLCDWDDERVTWAEFERCVLRSPWSYTRRPEAFRAWCEATSAATQFINPLDAVTWSLDKRYLDDLARAGIPIVDTHFVGPGSPGDAAITELINRGSDFVIKPTVGANSRQVRRFTAGQTEDALAHVELIHSQGKVAMAQPYLSAIDELGETNLIYFGGVFSHAIRKAALLGDDGSTSKPTMGVRELRVPGDDELEVAEAALRVAASRGSVANLAYARVDLVRDDAGRPVVLELELCEPSFSMPLHPVSAGRYVEAILKEIRQAAPANV